MGLGDGAFDDAAELIAMLKENLAAQRERLAEAAAYSATRPEPSEVSGTGSTSKDQRQSQTSQRGAPAWRAGMETIPLHAAQKRLAFASLLSARYGAAASAAGATLDPDVTSAVCVRVLPNDRASVLLRVQRRRVRELEQYTTAQIALLAGLVAPTARK
jgi:hypothetical protein